MIDQQWSSAQYASGNPCTIRRMSHQKVKHIIGTTSGIPDCFRQVLHHSGSAVEIAHQLASQSTWHFLLSFLGLLTHIKVRSLPTKVPKTERAGCTAPVIQ